VVAVAALIFRPVTRRRDGGSLHVLLRVFWPVVAVLAAGFGTSISMADPGYNAPTPGRNVSNSYKRYASKSSLPTAPASSHSPPLRASVANARQASYAKNLNIEPATTGRTLCAKSLRISCTLDAAGSATPVNPNLIQLELTPLRESLPVTPYLKPKNVYLRRNTLIVAYTFR
jgi:hypothetical protein